MPLKEILDIPWSYLKLASISRKQGLPTLAWQYLNTALDKIREADTSQHELIKFERFKHEYEQLKLEIKYNIEDPEGLDQKVMLIEKSFSEDQSYEKWQKA